MLKLKGVILTFLSSKTVIPDLQSNVFRHDGGKKKILCHKFNPNYGLNILNLKMKIVDICPFCASCSFIGTHLFRALSKKTIVLKQSIYTVHVHVHTLETVISKNPSKLIANMSNSKVIKSF